MPPTKFAECQSIEECHAIHQQRTVAARWIIGLVVAVLLLVIKLCVAHVDNDRIQDVKINRNEVQLERLRVIDGKLDKLIEMQTKRP